MENKLETSEEYKQRLQTEELTEEDEPSGVESATEENLDGDYINEEPFNPNLIKISSKSISVEAIQRRLKQRTLNINPSFQRNYVWDKERKSRLIESMILKIPLPMFYVSESPEGNWEVVDGLQRLSTIRDFVLGDKFDGNGFALEKMEFLSILNGKTFNDLNADSKANSIVNNIMDAQLSFTVISPDTPEKVKRNIFKRLNTGGMKLEPQEIRHALYEGKSTEILKELSVSEEFLNATDKSIKDGRMVARELILRFFAFYLNDRTKIANLRSRFSMDDLLSDTMMLMNDIENSDIVDLAITKFKVGMTRSKELFEKHAFRASTPRMEKKRAVNRYLFEVWANILSEMEDWQYSKLMQNKELFFEAYDKIISEPSSDFTTSIGRYAGSSSGAKIRYDKLWSLLNGVINNVA